MAVDKLVDSTQLDSDLTSVANAIRTKGGTSGQLAFPAGFVSAIGNIPSGGGAEAEPLSVINNGTYTAPTGTAYTPVTVNVAGGVETPEGYTRLKYLESSGTQVIDTGRYLKLNSKIVIDALFLKVDSYGYYAMLLGSANPTAYVNTADRIGVLSSQSTYNGFGNVSDRQFTTVKLIVRQLLKLNKNEATIEYYDYGEVDQTASIGANSVTENPNSHLCIFARGNNGGYERFSQAKVFEYWYYENDVLIQHLVPVRRNSDDVLGMYDLVNDEFFTNAGTGVFVGGAL